MLTHPFYPEGYHRHHPYQIRWDIFYAAVLSVITSYSIHYTKLYEAFPAEREEVPLKYRHLGQPVLVPGSMGTASWVLLGQPNAMNLSFGSTAHGAVITSYSIHYTKLYEDAALPVMEGKSVLYRKYGKINAFPICLNTTDKKKIIDTIIAIEPIFGAINL